MPTEEELDDAVDAIVSDATDGVKSMEFDGKRKENMSLKDRLDAIERLEAREVRTNPVAFLKTHQLVSPGCGG